MLSTRVKWPDQWCEKAGVSEPQPQGANFILPIGPGSPDELEIGCLNWEGGSSIHVN